MLPDNLQWQGPSGESEDLDFLASWGLECSIWVEVIYGGRTLQGI